jgi:hypothetical protein
VATVAHTCNPSYSGGRDQEDLSLKQIVLEAYLKNIQHKTKLVEWLKVEALSSNPSTTKKKKTGWWRTQAGGEPPASASLMVCPF